MFARGDSLSQSQCVILKNYFEPDHITCMVINIYMTIYYNMYNRNEYRLLYAHILCTQLHRCVQ